MPDRGHSPNRKPGYGADKGGVRLPQCLSRQYRGFGDADPVAARCQEQPDLACCLTTKDDGLHNLVDFATTRRSCLLRCAGVACFHDRICKARG